MANMQPVAAYALRIPPGNVLIPAVPGFQASSRITMAAIDPSEEPEVDASADKQKPRATLKIIRVADDMMSDDSEDYEDDEDDSEADDEEANGGPSSKKPSKSDILKAIMEAQDDDEDEDEDEDEDDEDMEEDSEDEAAAEALLAKLMKDAKKGKAKALDGAEEDSEDEDDVEDDVDADEMDEVVICTLDPEKAYQQTLDLVIPEGEKIFFKVSGNLTIHLTGNYVMPLTEPSDDEDEDDIEDYEDEELDALDALVDGADESDELDDLEDPRVMEVDSEEEKKPSEALPVAAGKGKNKRPAEESAEEDISLDNIIANSLKKEEANQSTDSKKLSKAEKKKQKKLKNNEGEAAAAPQTNGTAPDSDKKKVQFAKNLEQGPTPSAKPETKAETKADAKTDAKADSKKSTSVSMGVKTVSGVTVDDRKAGSGPAAKKGSRVEMRYIGKLKDGKVFDANKSGKPFSFKLGAGEVIKGWDIGIAGMSAGGERRLTIPANLAYGKQKTGSIPANSELTFDVKCISVK